MKGRAVAQSRRLSLDDHLERLVDAAMTGDRTAALAALADCQAHDLPPHDSTRPSGCTSR